MRSMIEEKRHRLEDRTADTPLRGCLSRVARERDGSMVIETALVLPTFFLLLFGIFQISMLLVGYCSATYAANVAARYASVNSLSSVNPASTTLVMNVVTANLFLPLRPQSTSINVTYGNNSSVLGNNVGGEVQVAVTVLSEKVVIPFWGTKTYTLQCQAYRYITR